MNNHLVSSSVKGINTLANVSYSESAPGKLIFQDEFIPDVLVTGESRIARRPYLHIAVDEYSSYAFGSWNYSAEPAVAASFLEDHVLLFFQRHVCSVKSVATEKSGLFCGDQDHPYESCLARYRIAHLLNPQGSPANCSCTERFACVIIREFLSVDSGSRVYSSFAELKVAFSTWLYHFNHLRPLDGRVGAGLTPIEHVRLWLNRDKS